MRKPFFKSKIFCLVLSVICSVLLPFYLLDEIQCLPHQDLRGNSVLENALRFYSGEGKAPVNPGHFIAVVTYIGLPDDFIPADLTPSMEEIINRQQAPASKVEPVRFNFQINFFKGICLYACIPGNSDHDQPTIVCITSPLAAFALVAPPRG